MEAASEECGRLLLIEGPAGIGKTRLVHEARARAEARRFETLGARGSDLERDLPFGIVRQVFEPLLVSASDKERDSLLSGAAVLAESAFGDEHLDAGTSEDASYATVHGLYWLTANLTARGPMLIAIDDAQWSDAASLRWLAYLIKRIEGLSTLVVVAFTAGAPGAADELLGEAISDPLADVLRLAPLSTAGASRLVRASLAPDAESEFCAACHSVTQGNPFLLHKLLDELAYESVAPTDDCAARVFMIGPKPVSRVVHRRLARLPREATSLAQAVAVLGDDAELTHAAALAGLDAKVAAEASRWLSGAEILRDHERLGFAHPIVRTAIYSELLPAECARSHACAARLLQAAGAPTDQIAQHLLKAERSGDPWVVETLRGAARTASARGAREEAASYLRRAFAEPPPAEARVELLVELGWTEVHTRESQGFDHLREALALAQTRVQRGTVALELGRALAMVGDLHEAASVLHRALSELGSAEGDLAMRLQTEFVSVALATPSTIPVTSRRLAQLGDHLQAGGPDNPTLLACFALAAAMEGASREKAANLAKRALEAHRLPRMEGARILPFIGNALAWSDELELAEGLWRDALTEARRRGSALLFATASCFRSNVAYRCGSLREAEADARAALEAADPAAWGFPASIYPLAFLVEALVAQGKLSAAAEALERGDIGNRLPELPQFNRLLYSRAGLRIAQGRIREGTQDLLECGRRLEAFGVRNPAVIPWRSTAALGLLMLEDREEADRLASDELALARRFGARSALGVALRAAGLAADGRKGLTLLREAVAVLEQTPSRLELACALIELGTALRRRGRRSDARQPLRHGLQLTVLCAASPLADRAHKELVAAGARPRRAMMTGASALTASEDRVARMVIEGPTNREVAQALFVTEKTVEMHLSNAYQKLGISSRSQLAKALGNDADADAK